MSQQKALLLLAKQGSLEVGSRAIPTAEANQVLVKVTAAAINPAEWKVIDTGAFLDEFPAVLGVDAAGVIETVGSEVNRFEKGDRVFLEGRFKPYDFSAFQQYILADSELVSKTPSNISDDQAASIPLGAVTSISALFLQSGIAFPDNGPTATGKSIFITGGSTSVGQYAIQLARIAGFSPIATTASPKHEEYLKSLGATHIFDRDVDAKTVQAAFPSGVSLVFDIVITSETKKLIFDILTTGSIVPDAHLAIAGRPDPALQDKLKDKVSINFVFGDGYLYKHLSVPFWKVIGKWVEEGKIVPNRIQVVEGGLAGVPKALELSKKGVSAVKLVVHPQE